MWNRFLSKAVIPLTALALLLSLLPAAQAQNRDQTVVLDTTKGRIVIRVFYSMVPYTAGRFLELVDNGFYNGLTWHRVENWVIQGGDPNGNGSGSALDQNGNPRYLRLEIHPQLKHNQPGMVAMARSANPNSASCQFYILKSRMPQLNGQYAVFGQVVDGAGVVMNIQPGDRILNASIVQPGGGGGGGGGSGDRTSGGDGAIDYVPGASSAPVRTAPAPLAPVEITPPPRKPAVPGRYSLPGSSKRQPEQAVEQQQAPTVKQTPPPAKRDTQDSGF
jgi:peptidyl-prolyl cis-trans isomerase B (cyclophilin B)